MARGSACGKFLLAGEHSIVDGGCALSLPLVSLRVALETTDADPRFVLNGVPLAGEDEAAVRRLVSHFGAPPTLGLRIESQVPIGSGLGSSAALCTALARALWSVEGRALAERALEGERLFHASPSGVDPFTVALEQPLVFRGLNEHPLELPLGALRAAGLGFVLLDSGEPHRTANVQKQVQARRTADPASHARVILSLRQLADDALASLTHDPRARLGPVMNEIHGRLRELGVSSPALEAARQRALEIRGALGAKLTGAGCGGFVVALVDLDEAKNDPSFLRMEKSGFVFR